MPSPFPGMDPYLEGAEWPGVHAAMIVAIQTELNLVLPEGYAARIEEYVWVQETPSDEHRLLIKPDTFIPERRGNGRSHSGTATATEPTARVTLPRSRKRKNRFIEIVTAQGRRVLTVIELLCPSNKRGGEDRDSYLVKRREYLASANLVELDLLRSGDRMPMGRPSAPTTDYYAFVCSVDEYPNADVWAFSVREPLPVVPVPLNDDSDPVPLSLRRCLDRVYDNGRYAAQLDYGQPAEPPLRPDDARWAAELLASRKGA